MSIIKKTSIKRWIANSFGENRFGDVKLDLQLIGALFIFLLIVMTISLFD